MIEIAGFIPSSAHPRLIDTGFYQVGIGGAATRIDRPGMRWEIELGFAPQPVDTARVLAARLAQARSDGLRVVFPLAGQDQGAPGNPVVDGTDSGGTTLKLRSVTPGYRAREGYWLTLNYGTTRSLHQVASPAMAGSDGKVTLAVWPPLRTFPADGATVALAAPTVEGMLTSDIGWDITPDKLRYGFSLTLREAG